MKDNEPISLKSLLKLTDFDIKQDEICWNKVKMSSSRWITCCHRKTVSGVYYSSPSASSTSSSSNRRPITDLRDQFNSQNQNNHHHHHQSQQQQHHRQSPTPAPHQQQPQSLFSTPKSNGRIFPGLPIPFKKKHHQYHLSDEINSVKLTNCSPFTASTSSPSDSSSLFELARKSSSLSSSSSTTSSSTTTTNHSTAHGHMPESSSHHFERTPTIMKHSASTFDLSSSASLQNNPQFAQPYSSPYHNRYHHQQSSSGGNRAQDDTYLVGHQSMPASEENTITIINPLDGFLINCQTNFDTTCAQISPGLDVIAVANDYWLAFYSIRTNECYGTLQFPSRCLFWCWIGSETIAMITENDVFHWTLTVIEPNSNYIRTRDPPRLQFSLDPEIRDNQITDYSIDITCGAWCAVSSLFLDEDNGDIGGKIQIFSRAYQKSQCIEAHCSKFTSYQFEDSAQKSTLLLAAKRENDFHWKLHIVELGPIPEGNHNHRSKTQQLMLHPKRLQALGLNSRDIPTNIICDDSIGLIYLMSKYGSFYICDIETGLTLYYDLLDIEITEGQALFSFSFDQTSDTLVAVSRTGLVISILIDIDHLIENSQTCVAQPKIAKRIRARRLQQEQIAEQSPPQPPPPQPQLQQHQPVHISNKKSSSKSNGHSSHNNHNKHRHNGNPKNGHENGDNSGENGHDSKPNRNSVNIIYSTNNQTSHNSSRPNLPKHYQHNNNSINKTSSADHRHHLQYHHQQQQQLQQNQPNNILQAEWNNNNIDIQNFRLKAKTSINDRTTNQNGRKKLNTEEESESGSEGIDEGESEETSEDEDDDDDLVTTVDLHQESKKSSLLPHNLHLKHRQHSNNRQQNGHYHHNNNNNNNIDNNNIDNNNHHRHAHSHRHHSHSHHHHHRIKSKPVVHLEEDEEITRL